MLARFATLNWPALIGAAANGMVCRASKLESDRGCLLRPGALSLALNLPSNWSKLCFQFRGWSDGPGNSPTCEWLSWGQIHARMSTLLLFC